MANFVSINISTGYSTDVLAWTDASATVTKAYDEDLVASNGLSNGDVIVESLGDNTPYDGGGMWYYTDNITPGSTPAIPGVFQIDTSGVVTLLTTTDPTTTTTTTTTLPLFTCADFEVDVTAIEYGRTGATIDTNSISLTGNATLDSISSATYISGTNDYDIDVIVPGSGYSNSGQTINCTNKFQLIGVDRSIAWTSTLSNFDSTGLPAQTITIQIDSENQGQFNLANHISFNSSTWSSIDNDVIVTLQTASTTSATLEVSINENLDTNSRSGEIIVAHPEDGNITATTQIQQSGGDAIPEAYDWSINMTNQGDPQNPSYVDLDFSLDNGGSSWTGQKVQDVEDTLDADLRIHITQLPGNGAIYDITDLNNALTLPAILDQNNGQPTIRYIPNTGYNIGGVETIRYKAVDSAPNETDDKNILITVNGPQNTGPTLTSFTKSVAGFGSNRTVAVSLGDFASDDSDPDENLTYYWSTTSIGPTGGNEITTGATLQLTDGILTANSKQLLTYEYTGPETTPNTDPAPMETFWWTAKDSQNEPADSSATGTFNVSIPGNSAPVFQPDSETRSVQQYNSISGSVTANDSDGNPLTYSKLSQSGGGSMVVNSDGSWTYESGTWDITPGTIVDDVIEIQADDGFGGTDIYTLTISVTGVSYIQIEYSTLSSTSDNACNSNQNNIGYLDIQDATNINELAPGHKLYVNGDFTDWVKATADATWVSVFQNISGTPTSKALQLDQDGLILSSFPCAVVSDQAWPLIVNYSTNADDLCYSTSENSQVWQNVLDPAVHGTVSLTDVFTAGGQLFTNEYYANQYDQVVAPSGVTVPVGFYNDYSINSNQYYEWLGTAWSTDGLGECLPPIQYATYSAKIAYNEFNTNSIDAACLEDNLQISTIWFRTNSEIGIESLNDYERLEYVMTQQVVVFTDEAAANALDYDLLWDSTVFIAVDENSIPLSEFAIWENDNSSGYSGNYRWKGAKNGNPDQIGEANADDNLALCSVNFTQPAPDSVFEVNGPTVSKNQAFYAFYSCNAKFENGEAYWPMYIVDGLHTDAVNSTSYIKEFIDAVGGATKLGGPTMLECVTLTHKVWAINTEDASAVLHAFYRNLGREQRTININPVDLGFTSGATIDYGYADCSECLSNEEAPNSFTLDIVDDAEIINRSIPNFDLEKNYELDFLSKPLLRTNPKLSTNAKLVVNLNDEMYIESIDATKELAAVEYKKWAVNRDGQWSYDLAKFFKSNNTTSDQIYLAKNNFSDFNVQESFDKQIEEDYHYGTVYNYSKIHDEDFRMMAPIWLDRNIPSKFIVFKVNDPSILDFDAQDNYSNISTILSNSEIIETFDLTRKSNLGNYIRNHVKSESFPSNPITFNFDKNEKTLFNGIDIKKGGFTSKGEFLYEDFVKKDQTIIAENNLITNGFERNGLACANLINLEFLFNDPTADSYSINRYFGLYVDDVDSGYGSLDSANNGVLKFKTLNSYINDDNISAIPPFELIKNTPTLGYAHVANSGDFYKISDKRFYDTSSLEVIVEDSINSIGNEVKLAPTGKSIDTVKNSEPGRDFLKINILDNPAVNDRFGIFPSKEQLYRIKFKRYKENDQFQLSTRYSDSVITFTLGPSLSVTVGQLNGYFSLITGGNLEFEVDGEDIICFEKMGTLQPLELEVSYPATNTTILRVDELQTPYDLSNNMFFADSNLEPGHFNSVSFSNQGTRAEVASAIVKSINAADNGFTATTYDGAEFLYIKSDVIGYRQLQAGLAVPNDNANNFIGIDNEFQDVDNLLRLDFFNGINNGLGSVNNILSDSTIYFFNGGHAANKSVLVTLDSVQDVNIGDFIDTRSSGVFNKIIDIVDDTENLPSQYKKLILERTNALEDGEIKVFADSLVMLGLFSAYDIHDMNFDFYDTSNSDLKELKYETQEEINYEPEIDNNTDIYPFGERQNTDYDLDPANYFTGLNDILSEERADEFNENIIYSEYDRLQENNLKEYAVTSRVVPTINKWVLKDSVTVREQPYYLNANEAFGRSNFSADMSVADRNRLGMTHEWFYVNNLPTHLTKNVSNSEVPAYRLNESFSYLNFMEGFEINSSIFKDTNYDYFDRFFVTEGFEKKGENNYKTFVKTNRQKKYTLIDNGNDLSFANTIFKGIKVSFKNRKEFVATNPVDFIKSSEFNGYRFSILLNIKTAEESNDVEYEVIQNKKFKFVVFYISLKLDDLWADKTLTKKLLYELKHSLVWDNENNTFQYSDIKIDGALRLTSLNQTNELEDDYLVIEGMPHQDGSVPQFLEQINKNDDNEFGKILVQLNTAFGPQILQLEIEKIEGQDVLKLRKEIVDITNGVDPVTGEYPIVDLSSMPAYLAWNAEYTYIKGGINAYNYVLNALGIQNVANMLLREPNNIKYTTVNLDGSIENNKFVILFEDGVEIIKESFIVTREDDDKPESFKLFSGNIGYNLDEGMTYYPFLIRQNGGYTIDTKPVVTFTDVYSHMKTNTLQSTSNINELLLEEQMYKHSLSNLDAINLARDYYRKYNRCGVAFNLGFIYDGGTHDLHWGQIKNHFYRKVNEFNAAGITKLSTSTDKLPLYPLIGEIAIDKKDVHVFRSSWDKNYYTRAISGGGSEPIPGTFETKEEKSYLASTIMHVDKNYTLLQFNTNIVKTEEELDDILRNNTNTSSIVMFEDDTRVVLDFYIDYTINKRLSYDGVLNAISKYVAPEDSAEDKTSLVDDSRLYVDKNLINTFNVAQIKLYTKRIKGEASSLESVTEVELLDNGGYVVDQNFSFKAHEQKPLNFRLIYNKRLGYSYRIRPMVKITS